MANFRFNTMAIACTAMTLSATLWAGSAGAIENNADCEYEGGEVFPVHNDIVCIVPIRAEAYHGEEYDGEQLGVKECSGTVIANGQFCKITLVKGEPQVSETAIETVIDEEAKPEDVVLENMVEETDP